MYGSITYLIVDKSFRKIGPIAAILLLVGIILVIIGGSTKKEKVLNPGIIILSVSFLYFVFVYLLAKLTDTHSPLNYFIDSKLFG